MIWSPPPLPEGRGTAPNQSTATRPDPRITVVTEAIRDFREAHRVLCFGDIVKKPLLHLKLITIKHYVSCKPHPTPPQKKVREREREKKINALGLS